MITLRADPRAIATRIKVGIEAEPRVRSASGTFEMMRLETKLQDMPKPIPMIAAKSAINQRGPAGMAYIKPNIETLTKTAPNLISLGSRRSLNPEVKIAVIVQPKDSSACLLYTSPSPRD